MSVRLSARLACVACYVPTGSVVADIGTDHAYLPVYLVRNRIVDRVVAGEVTRGPYRIAIEAVRTAGLDSQIEVRLGDGLQVIYPGEVNVVVLAGMGGRTICGILASGRSVLERLERLILQPMRDAAMVRHWLVQNGWQMTDEDMVYEDNHFYVVIVARPGREKITDSVVFELGPRLMENRSAVFRRFLLKRRADIGAVLRELQTVRGTRVMEKSFRLQREADKIEEVLNSWPSEQRT
ncbi:MAG TPA: SAM-dependent methyltransferase [Desulfotomaculum sp.]|nr:MAG: hypothetical protein VR67_14495 [Peptococcaceae bacterium BRH_c8a]KJS78767.1 MAG: hypothetical protein JL56_00785 [Desulfotomaculum sp. BICA1-6]HBX24536.1 SAM-dependent methyltransferase [Desulfotomaculum sp.]